MKACLGPVEIQPPLATLAHFRPLAARFFSSTSSTSRKIRLPEGKNVLRVARKVESQQALAELGQAIPHSPNRLNQSVCKAATFELVPQVSSVGVHRAHFAVEVFAPKRLDNSLS